MLKQMKRNRIHQPFLMKQYAQKQNNAFVEVDTLDQLSVVEFNDSNKQEIHFDETVKNIIFEDVEVNKPSSNTGIAAFTVDLLFDHNRSCHFPMILGIDQTNSNNNHSNSDNSYSFDLTHIKKMVISSENLLPIKLFYKLI